MVRRRIRQYIRCTVSEDPLRSDEYTPLELCQKCKHHCYVSVGGFIECSWCGWAGDEK